MMCFVQEILLRVPIYNRLNSVKFVLMLDSKHASFITSVVVLGFQVLRCLLLRHLSPLT